MFLLVGYGTKVGLAPFHAWLPDAHAEGPTPISAVLSGLLLNVALYALLRFKMVLAANPATLDVGSIMMALGLVSLVFAAFMLYRRRDIKRLFAYSSIEHMGIMTFAFGMGGPLANFAGLLHMTMHSLTKSAIFFTVGHIAQVKGTQRIADISGLSVTHPVLAVGLRARRDRDRRPAAVRRVHQRVHAGVVDLRAPAAARRGAGVRVCSCRFGALVLRLQDVVFGEPSGPTGDGQGVLCAAVPASRAGADGGPVAARSRWCAGSAPSRRCSGDAMTRHASPALFADRTPVAGHRPWPRYEVDAATWDAIGAGARRGRRRSARPVGRDRHRASRAARRRRSPRLASSRCDRGPAASRRSAAITRRRSGSSARSAISTASPPTDAPDRRPWLDHGAWGLRAPLGGKRRRRRSRDPADYDFLPVHGEGLHQIPVGPVHAGIIEPGHFRFTANGETVARLEERLGYVHKGIDGLLTDCELDRAARIVARVSGDSTVADSFAFARAVEAALGIEAPPRAQVLRGVMAELERIANHLGDIGAICNDAAFALHPRPLRHFPRARARASATACSAIV